MIVLQGNPSWLMAKKLAKEQGKPISKTFTKFLRGYDFKNNEDVLKSYLEGNPSAKLSIGSSRITEQEFCVDINEALSDIGILDDQFPQGLSNQLATRLFESLKNKYQDGQ